MTTQELNGLNVEIGRAEKGQDVEYLEGVLHEKLVFRRANGTIVGKTEFLAGVRRRRYGVLRVADVEADERGDVAVCTMSVHADGSTDDGGEFRGVFANVRVFVREEGRWLLLAWANTRTGDLKR